MLQPLRPSRLTSARFALALTASGLAASGLAQQVQGQEQLAPASRTEPSRTEPSRTGASQIEASQIEASQIKATADNAGGKAYLGPTPSPAPRPSRAQTAGLQISAGGGTAPASQITRIDQGGSGIAQLSKADLDATLAQLSAAERRVLMQAIAGTDICDNPPAVAAIIALCQNRLETRSQEFAAPIEAEISAEERLLRGDFDDQTMPSVDQVIERLARTNAASNDFNNQEIASIALAVPAAPASGRKEEQVDPQSVSEEAQALINALINQLGGRAP
jgi:hypothetical protein